MIVELALGLLAWERLGRGLSGRGEFGMAPTLPYVANMIRKQKKKSNKKEKHNSRISIHPDGLADLFKHSATIGGAASTKRATPGPGVIDRPIRRYYVVSLHFVERKQC